MSRVSIGNIESGAHSPLLDSLLLISDAVGVPLWELIRPMPEEPRPPQ